MVESRVLSTEEFKEFGDDAVLFLHVTSRTEDEPHPDMLMEKGGRGFPYFVVMDETGAVVAQHNGARSVEGFRGTLAAAKPYLELRDKAASGDAEAQTAFLIKRLELGNIEFEEAVAERKALTKVSDEQNAELDRLIVEQEFQSIRNQLRRREDLPVVGKKFADMQAAGRVPGGRSAVEFWMIMSFHAEETKDVALFEKIVEKMQDNEMLSDAAKKDLQRRLEELKNDG